MSLGAVRRACSFIIDLVIDNNEGEVGLGSLDSGAALSFGFATCFSLGFSLGFL
jgi:hypothetical protein